LKYFQLLFAPVKVTGDYDYNSIPIASAGDWVAWAGLAVVAAALVYAIRSWPKKSAVAFGILFFYITILPVSNWLIPTSLIMAERFLYLPSMGVCLVAGFVWTSLPHSSVKQIAGAGILAAAILLCISDTFIWRNELSFYRNIVQVLPNNVRGRQGYGVALVEAGRPD